MGAIGIFDSGVGGLTVARAIMEELPGRRVIYLGDTARVPYGPKSPRTIRRFSKENGDFLADHGIDALVVACNTASALAIEELHSRYPFPVLGVLEPGVREGLRAAKGGPLGVIGTVGTIKSAAYRLAAARLDSAAVVECRACPLFVPLAEEGMVDHLATELIARDYLEPLTTAGIRALVLGCTHYPLLAPIIQRVVGADVTLVDSADAVARELVARLPDAQAGSEATVPPSPNRFFVTDIATRFSEVGARFLGSELPAVELADLVE